MTFDSKIFKESPLIWKDGHLFEFYYELWIWSFCVKRSKSEVCRAQNTSKCVLKIKKRNMETEFFIKNEYSL